MECGARSVQIRRSCRRCSRLGRKKRREKDGKNEGEVGEGGGKEVYGVDEDLS